LDEREAIRLCQGGDKESFRFLVELYKDKTFRIACLILNDPAAAEDVTQEAFWSAFRSIHTFELGRPFAPWLIKIVVRCSMKRLSKKSIQVTIIEKDDLNVADPRPVPDRALQAKETTDCVRHAIEQLSPHLCSSGRPISSIC